MELELFRVGMLVWWDRWFIAEITQIDPLTILLLADNIYVKADPVDVEIATETKADFPEYFGGDNV